MTRPNEEQIAEALRIARSTAEGELKYNAREGVGADDIAQDVMIQFMELDLAAVHNWQGWVATAARNRSVDVLRADRRHRKRLDEQRVSWITQWVMGPSARVLGKDATRRVLAVLTTREQQILWLHSKGVTNGVIAEEFGYADARSAAVAISRARKKVRDSFQDRGEIIEPQRPYGQQRADGGKARGSGGA